MPIKHKFNKNNGRLFKCLPTRITIALATHCELPPYLHPTSSPSISLSTASEGRPIISNVFSQTLCEVSTLWASSEGLVGLQSWEMKAQTGQSSDFNNWQYSGTWGSVAANRALLEPENHNISSQGWFSHSPILLPLSLKTQVYMTINHHKWNAIAKKQKPTFLSTKDKVRY